MRRLRAFIEAAAICAVDAEEGPADLQGVCAVQETEGRHRLWCVLTRVVVLVDGSVCLPFEYVHRVACVAFY
jgi:hypothetical protein